MTISDGLMIFAVLLGPILAVQVQKFIEARQEKRKRRLYIFRTLMATRGTPIVSSHVEALNMIDIEFYGAVKNDKKVVEFWRTYFDHLCRMPRDVTDSNYQTNYNIWASKREDLLVDLLYEISGCLGYSFDKAVLRSGAYVPQAHQDIENEQTFLRRSLIDVFLNKRPIPININNLPIPSRVPVENTIERRSADDQRN